MLSLYVHIPFCVKKCLYCGFYSTPYREEQAETFLTGLRKEAEQYHAAFLNRPFSTVYVGGGTPTILSPDQLDRMFGILSGSFHLAPNAEFTVEANPNTISGPLLSLIRQRGANRLSIGIQSFSPDLLRTLGRTHNAEEAVNAVLCARKAGFRNIGIDLIYGIPGQHPALWQETLEQAIGLSPEHISAYNLSLDEGSAFLRMAKEGAFRLPDDDEVAGMYELAVEKLTASGYSRYELSNFARPGFACRHNRNYWARGEYLGLGPGAWSFIGGRRRRTVPDVTEYAQRLNAGLGVTSEEDAPAADQAAQEYLFLGLRTSQGVNLRDFQRLYGRGPYERLLKNLSSPRNAGLVQVSGEHLRLTGSGMLLADEAILQLYP
jgi:oxygen-independent coproporphyrinogen-3 oxidase